MDEKIVCELYKNNSMTSVSNKTGFSTGRIKKCLIKNNIKLHTRSQWLSKSFNKEII